MSKSRRTKQHKLENKILNIGINLYRAKALSRILYSLTAEPRAGIIQKYDEAALAFLLYTHLEKIYDNVNDLERIFKI